MTDPTTDPTSSFPQPSDAVLSGYTDRDLTVPVAVPRSALAQVVVDNWSTSDGAPVYGVVGVTTVGQRIVLNQLDSPEGQAAYIQASAPVWLAAQGPAGGLLTTPVLTATGSVTTLYTVPAAQRVRIASAVCCNASGTPAVLSAWMVPTGATAGPACQVMSQVVIPSTGAPMPWPALVGTILGPGDSIAASLAPHDAPGGPAAALSVGLSVLDA